MSKKWVDKKRDKTYKLVHRAHEDPLFHDEEAPENVLMEVEHLNLNKTRNRKVKTKTQLEQELGDELKSMRKNEGEAALYGITFDDSKYDYMQHLKPMGTGEGVYVANKSAKPDKKSTGIIFKEDEEVELPEDAFGSKNLKKLTYQDQQNLPDEIAGFKPDMNPALREVLEALEDEAYVEEDDAIFENLLESGEQVDEEDFEEQFDEWDLDNYADEMAQYDTEHFAQEGDEGWEAGYRQYKAMTKNKKNDWDSDDEFDEEEEDVVPDLPSFNDTATTKSGKKGSKRKDRYKKGAMSDTSNFSMSSSALFRNEGLTFIDDKFEKVLKDFEEEEEGGEEEEYKPFDMENEREDFESLLDDFLDNYEIEAGRRLVKKNEEAHKLKEAVDSTSTNKLALRRKKQSKKQDSITSSLSNLKI